MGNGTLGICEIYGACSQSWSESYLDQACVRYGSAHVFYGALVQRVFHG